MFMDITAIANFRAVERFLADPGIPSAEVIHNAGQDKARILLRRAAGESNGWLFEQWEWIQLIVGLALLLVLLFGERPPKIPMALVVIMMILVMVERFALTPNVMRLGRIVEFLPADPKLPDRVSFHFYHTAYTALDLVKLTASFAIAAILIFRRQPDPQMFAREASLGEYTLKPRRDAR
jgi:hypothetical protein